MNKRTEVAVKAASSTSRIGSVAIRVYETKHLLGRDAALEAAALIQEAIRTRGSARVVFAAANSQLEMAGSLVSIPGIAWESVEAFHMDEYVGLPTSHPQSFGGWLKRNIAEKVHPAKVHYISGDSKNLEEECSRYADLLREAPIDLCLLGIGENGHIAFNDPHAADFSDPKAVKTVSLDERCRLQQVGEGHWPSFSHVPTEGITLTCPVLMSATRLVCCVPGAHKAEAVRNALEGPITTTCPASLLRTHPRAAIYLDVESVSLLSESV